jgi:hypothetical protein
MPKKDIIVWFVVAISILFLAFFPLLNLAISAPVEPWHLVLVLNIVLPLTLWLLIKDVEIKHSGSGKHLPVPHVKLENHLKVPGLELRIPIWIFSVALGLLIAVPGIIGFGRFYGAFAQLSPAFFNGIIQTLFLIWAVSAVFISYTYLKSRSAESRSYASFQIFSPLLGALVGILGAVHVLFMIFLTYLPQVAKFSSEDIFTNWFYQLFVLTRMNRITTASVEIVFGFFLIELVILLSVYMSRKTYGNNKAREYKLIAMNLAISVILFSVLFFVIPYLFSPLSSIFKILVL